MAFFSGLSTYGAWDATTQETLSKEEKASIEKVVVREGQYGPTACFVLIGTKRVKMVQMDRDCEDIPVGTELDIDSVVFQHYTDGEQVATRCIANPK